jgi:hypothetical protein
MRNIICPVVAGFALSMPLPRSSNAVASDAPPAATQPAANDQAAFDGQFEKTMTNAEMRGLFTIEGDDKPLKEEHYTIASVRKLKGDLWLINARIRFGSKDVTVPLILPVKWAGDTPVITVTNVGIPGIGTYTARVLIYDDHYAGIWSGSATHRGALFGTIQHPAATQPAP